MSIQSTKDEPLPKALFSEKGEFKRPNAQFRNFISRESTAQFPAEKDRYHLYVSYACPWAHRVLIVRKLKGLESILPVTSVHWHMDLVDSWRFRTADEEVSGDACVPDPLYPDFTHFKQLYFKANPDYTGRFTVPIIWDKKLETIVSNESSEIIRMLYTEFDDLLPEEYQWVDLYPSKLREEIDATNEWTYDTINNGVYKCGAAQKQQAYHEAVTALFQSLDKVETHLSKPNHFGPYYFGAQLTEADIRLYVTIIRFDPVYVSLFKTNKAMIRFGYPAIHKWMQNLYFKEPAFRDTTNFEHIKGHYFVSLTVLNPRGVVPDGPVPNVVPLEEGKGQNGVKV